MALTEEQFATIVTTHRQVQELGKAVRRLESFAGKVLISADPGNPVSADLTMQDVTDARDTKWATLKAAIQAAYLELP